MKKFEIDKEKLEILYNDLKSARKIAEKLNTTECIILYNLKKFNIKTFRKKYTLNENEIIKTYQRLKNVRKTAKYFNCRVSTVSNILNKNNIERSKAGRNRKYSLNENYFKTLTPESVYWLGFIAADGYLNKNYLEIQLSSKDYNHLEKFKNSLNSSYKIEKRLIKNSERNSKWNDSETALIRLSSISLLKDLKQYNIKESFPKQILESEFINHFCRGYFDGDGGFSKYKDQLHIKIVGEKEFLQTFLHLLEKNCNITKNKKIGFCSNIYNIQFNGNNICNRIINWLYKDATLYLDRKYEIAKPFINNPVFDRGLSCPDNPIQDQEEQLKVEL